MKSIIARLTGHNWKTVAKKIKEIETGKIVIIKFVAVFTSIFSIYANGFSFLPPIIIRAIYWGLILTLVFLYAWKKKNRDKSDIFEFTCIGITVINTIFLILRWERFAMGIYEPTVFEIIIAVSTIVLTLEVTRRTLGWALPSLTMFFLLYALFGSHVPGLFISKDYSIQRIATFLFWSTSGIYGLPMYIVSGYVMLFLIFGVFLLRSGGEKWFLNLSYAMLGKFRGGPALMAIASSAFFGMMTGSPVANVATTGSFSIPLMKDVGYKKDMSAAISAVASIGGMFTPPIMGAATFIMAEYVGVPYKDIAIAAVFPALLFYISLMSTSYLQAIKLNVSAISKDKLPNLVDVFKKYGHLIPPVFILLFLLLSGTSLMRAGLWSIIAILLLATIRKNTRMPLIEIINALGEATEKVIPVAVACASAGIIFGIISLTGLGFRVSSLLLSIAGSNTILVLLLSALIAILLGFAMPPTAAYLILAALIVPSLIEIGLMPLVAHMFLFFFCCIGPITPPVALASYTAAAIAKSNPTHTGFIAFRIGLASYIIPFLFVLNPEILMVGQIGHIIWIVLKSIIFILSLSFLLEGYFKSRLLIYLKFILFGMIIMIFYNNLYLNIFGLIGIAMESYYINKKYLSFNTNK